MTRRIGLLVSGHTEVAAAPILIRRVLYERLSVFDVQPDRVLRKAENQLLKEGSIVLEQSIQRLRQNHDAVLVMVDLEDDCPARRGPMLQARCDAACPDKPVAFVAAWREFETWFLWDANNLIGVQEPTHPERGRDAKKFLKKNRIDGYNEVADAPGFAARLDLERVRARSDSFRVFCDRVERLARALAG